MSAKPAAEESLPVTRRCQEGARGRFRAGLAARESTIARACAAAVTPSESSGTDTAATIAPVRVSDSRTWSQVEAGGSASPTVEAGKYTVWSHTPHTVVPS